MAPRVEQRAFGDGLGESAPLARAALRRLLDERPLPAPHVDDTFALELLQYEFGPHVVDWRAWRLPVALAALCALTWIVGNSTCGRGETGRNL